MGKGWIKIHRQITENILYDAEPYDRLHAWIDLLLRAQHDKEEFVYKGQHIHLEEGQLITSPSALANRWKWSRNKVYRFLKLLSDTQMVTRVGTPNGTLLTIVNYGKFQGKGTTNGTPNETPKRTPDGTPNETHTRNIKNDKEEKKDSSPTSTEEAPVNNKEEGDFDGMSPDEWWEAWKRGEVHADWE